MKVGKKIVAMLCVITLFTLYKTNYVNAQNLSGFVIGLDAGHGGEYGDANKKCTDKSTKDNGNSGNNLVEGNLTLQVMQSLRGKIQKAGASIIESKREYKLQYPNGVGCRLKPFTDAPKLDFVIGVHFNGSTDNTANGSEALYWHKNNNNDEKKLADYCLTKVTEAIGFRLRGVKGSDKAIGLGATPVVTLEIGFLTNKGDADKIKDKNFIENVSTAIYNGIVEYLKWKYPAKLSLSSVGKITPNPLLRHKKITISDVVLKNEGRFDFNGQMAVALHNKDGNYLGDIGGVQKITLKSGASSGKLTFSNEVLSSVAGDYFLYYKYNNGSGWATISKQTVTIKCENVSGIFHKNIRGGIKFSFNPLSFGATFEYKPTTSKTWKTIDIPSHHTYIDVTGLSSGTQYDVRIKSNCNGQYTSYTSLKYISSGRIEMDELKSEEDVIIYPNPSNSFVNFSKEVTFDLYSANGQKIRSYENILQIDISDLNNGMYIIRFENGESKKLLIQK